MEEEAKVAPMSYRTQMLSQLRNYRRDIDQLSRALASNFLHSEFLKYNVIQNIFSNTCNSLLIVSFVLFDLPFDIFFLIK